jgi:NAD(P)-dependent dehydrogenase (short-subunit alcohol dehydrogenase family)
VNELNFTGTLNTFASFLPLLDAGNKHPDSVGKEGYVQSQFITLGSIASFSREIVMDIPYAASKAALVHLTKMLATEYSPYKIRVNSLAPGLYPSEATGEIMGVTAEGTGKPGSLPIQINPALRSGSAEDMAGAILFLTSRAGAFLNGFVLLTDGGALNVHPASY